MKKNTFKAVLMIFLGLVLTTSCSKYKKFDNNEVIENTFTGSVIITSTGTDPAADFTGNEDSGTYSFAWVNSGTVASLNFDITAPSGSSVQFIINDKRGKEVLNKTLNGGTAEDTFSGVSDEGKSGTWKVTIIFTNFTGDGSYSVHPGS